LASKFEQSLVVMAALCHDLGKPVVKSPEGTFHNHDEEGLPLVAALCDRLMLGKRVHRSLAFATQNHHRVHRAQDLRPGSLTKLVTGANRTQLGLEGLLHVCEADHRSRGFQFEQEAYPQSDYLREASRLIGAVDFSGVENMTAAKRENTLNHAVRPLTNLRKVKK
jgi:tRNA nucleotidyltransferase (CCA-adding enzyme)